MVCKDVKILLKTAWFFCMKRNLCSKELNLLTQWIVWCTIKQHIYYLQSQEKTSGSLLSIENGFNNKNHEIKMMQ